MAGFLLGAYWMKLTEKLKLDSILMFIVSMIYDKKVVSFRM